MGSKGSSEESLLELRETFSRLGRRDWELWTGSLLLTTAFAGGMVACFYKDTQLAELVLPIAKRYMWLQLGGLIALVALVNVYFYQRKRLLTRLWQRSLSGVLESMEAPERLNRDPLTQVYSLAFFHDAVPRELTRCERSGEPLCFLLFRVEGLEEINRSQGHLVGDSLLQAIAGVLLNSLRSADMVFRLGGDEFLIVLPGAPLERVPLVEQRIRAKLNQQANLKELVGHDVTLSSVSRAWPPRGQLDSVVDELEGAISSRAEASAAG